MAICLSITPILHVTGADARRDRGVSCPLIFPLLSLVFTCFQLISLEYQSHDFVSHVGESISFFLQVYIQLIHPSLSQYKQQNTESVYSFSACPLLNSISIKTIYNTTIAIFIPLFAVPQLSFLWPTSLLFYFYYSRYKLDRSLYFGRIPL